MGETQLLLAYKEQQVEECTTVSVLGQELAATILLVPTLISFKSYPADGSAINVFRKASFKRVLSIKWSAPHIHYVCASHAMGYGQTQQLVLQLLGSELLASMLQDYVAERLASVAHAQFTVADALGSEACYVLAVLQEISPSVRDLKVLLTDCAPKTGILHCLVPHGSKDLLQLPRCCLLLVDGWSGRESMYNLGTLLLMVGASLAEFTPIALRKLASSMYELSLTALQSIVRQVKQLLLEHSYELFGNRLSYAAMLDLFQEQQYLHSQPWPGTVPSAAPEIAIVVFMLKCAIQSGGGDAIAHLVHE